MSELHGASLKAHEVPVPGRLREVSVGKAILLGIITLGIYTSMLVFKTSGDLHRKTGDNSSWKTFFWLAFVPYIGVIFTFILYFKNNKQVNQLREANGMAGSFLPFILMFIPIVNFVGPFVWAGHYNDLARRT